MKMLRNKKGFSYILTCVNEISYGRAVCGFSSPRKADFMVCCQKREGYAWIQKLQPFENGTRK